MKKYLILSLFCGLSTLQIGQSQTLRAVVADKTTRAPIENVFIFLANSSIGTASEADGRFELDLADNEQVVLVFSHINYETLTLELTEQDLRRDTFLLTPNNINLEEIQVVQKGNPRLRRRRLRKFTRAFLGESADPKLVKFANPEVLLFEEDKEKLIARATDALIIENKQLGYRLQFVLNRFELYRNNDLLYQGSAFFEPMADEARYREKRQRAYRVGSRYFFANLVRGTLDEADYEVGFSMLNSAGEFTDYQPVNLDSLTIEQPDDNTFAINVRGYLTVTNKRISSMEGAAGAPSLSSGMKDFQSQQSVYATSYLHSRSGWIIVNRYGRILNPKDIIEYYRLIMSREGVQKFKSLGGMNH